MRSRFLSVGVCSQCLDSLYNLVDKYIGLADYGRERRVDIGTRVLIISERGQDSLTAVFIRSQSRS